MVRRCWPISLVLAIALSGCAARQATQEGIVVKYDAYHPEVAETVAKKHCAAYGRNPIFVRTEPAASPGLFHWQFAVFNCVAPVKPPA
jgi:hypothetical protein